MEANGVLTWLGFLRMQAKAATYIPAAAFLFMATNSKKPTDKPAATGDPLFNLHHAEAEAELAKTTGGLGPTTNEYVSSDEEAAIDDATAPRDSQGSIRGAAGANVTGSSAGDHK